MPVLVQLRDSAGVALEGVSVTWAALDGGRVEGMLATDVGGNLEAQWVLGPKAGTQRLRLQVGDPRHVPAVTLRASATAAAPYRVSLTSARVPNRSVRQIAAKVVDSLGNAVPDVALTLEATSGTLDVSALRSDSLGRARVLWTPSPTPVAKTANKRAPAKSPTPAVRVRLDGTTLSASVTP